MREQIFTEKYRPKKVSDIIGDFKEKILNYLKNPQAIPNFILYSRTPGTGKSTLQKAIVNELGCDYLLLNSSDDRNLETVREKVKDFAMTKSNHPGMKRAILMDEFDGMTRIAQDALRNIMEIYSDNVFFVLTCNNINRIIQPIQSRCVLISFAYPSKEEIAKFLVGICNKEQMDYTQEGMMQLIELNYPSIRNCVISLQDLYTNSLSVTVENVKPAEEVYEEMWKMLQEKRWKEIKDYVMRSNVDARELNTFFWQKALDAGQLKTIQICCRNERDLSYGADERIILVTSLMEMVR